MKYFIKEEEIIKKFGGDNLTSEFKLIVKIY